MKFYVFKNIPFTKLLIKGGRWSFKKTESFKKAKYFVKINNGMTHDNYMSNLKVEIVISA